MVRSKLKNLLLFKAENNNQGKNLKFQFNLTHFSWIICNKIPKKKIKFNSDFRKHLIEALDLNESQIEL